MLRLGESCYPHLTKQPPAIGSLSGLSEEIHRLPVTSNVRINEILPGTVNFSPSVFNNG